MKSMTWLEAKAYLLEDESRRVIDNDTSGLMLLCRSVGGVAMKRRLFGSDEWYPVRSLSFGEGALFCAVPAGFFRESRLESVEGGGS